MLAVPWGQKTAMAERSEFGKNPFRPELGRMPPHLAGRDEDLEWWTDALLDTKEGGQGRLALMYGPRGMGKTALLDRFRDLAAAEGYDVIQADVGELNKGQERLADRLLAKVVQPGYRKAGRETGKGAAAKVGSFGGEVDRRSTEVYADPLIAYGGVGARLTAYAETTPLVLLLDEVHDATDLLALQEVANAGQTAALQSPCIMLLAGTPGLQGKLGDAGCHFTERAKSFGVGLLEPDDARDAIRRPLAETVWRLKDQVHLTVTDDALDRVLEESQRYPYFLQMWGYGIWNHGAAQNKDTLTVEDLAVVRKEVEREQQACYAMRAQDLANDAELLIAADAVIRAFDKAAALNDGFRRERLALNSEIDVSMAKLYPEWRARQDARNKAMDTLVRLGFIWMPPKEVEYAAGIPSYMNFIKQRYGDQAQRFANPLGAGSGRPQ